MQQRSLNKEIFLVLLAPFFFAPKPTALMFIVPHFFFLESFRTPHSADENYPPGEQHASRQT